MGFITQLDDLQLYITFQINCVLCSIQTVTVGGVNCPVLSSSNTAALTQVICNVQPGAGAALLVVLTAGSQVYRLQKAHSVKFSCILDLNPQLSSKC